MNYLRPMLGIGLTLISTGYPVCLHAQASPSAQSLKTVAVQGFDFGTQPVIAGPISHIFTVTNRGTASFTVDQLKPSCSCTTAVLEDGRALPVTVPPGGSLAVRVTVDPARLAAGAIHKTVWVFAKGQDDPVATLEVTGTLGDADSLATLERHDVALFDPQAARFGGMMPGARTTLLVTMVPMQGLAPAGAVYRLVSPDPNITAQPIAGGEAGTQRFSVTATATTLLGRRSLNLQLIVSAPGRADFIGGSLPITQQVVGDVSLASEEIHFGSALPGQIVTRQYFMTAKEADSLEITVGSPDLTVRCFRPQLPSRPTPYLENNSATSKTSPAISPSARILEVTWKPGRVSGEFRSFVRLRTRSGQELNVPVTAEVIAGKS